MASLLGMLAPFIITGILFVVAALLWARHKGQVAEKEVGSQSLERGGEA
ncbi:hypothetical protein NGM10_17980 (plasmid) [Halorussus salilacus]|nr:hypothetical protein [Halorussus salilacus]USZ70181.1 hypothetical protein NGM10_17980 [Halorussus salilacus]